MDQQFRNRRSMVATQRAAKVSNTEAQIPHDPTEPPQCEKNQVNIEA